jgi:putative DNA primase/helicase
MVRNIYAELYKTADYRDRVDDLDTTPWLLNVENGTIDLKTGELLLHRKEDMNLNRALEPKVRWAKVPLLITKLGKVRYDKGADCPMWKQFIREIMDYKAELIAFLQTAAGWAVSGDTSE